VTTGHCLAAAATKGGSDPKYGRKLLQNDSMVNEDIAAGAQAASVAAWSGGNSYDEDYSCRGKNKAVCTCLRDYVAPLRLLLAADMGTHNSGDQSNMVDGQGFSALETAQTDLGKPVPPGFTELGFPAGNLFYGLLTVADYPAGGQQAATRYTQASWNDRAATGQYHGAVLVGDIAYAMGVSAKWDVSIKNGAACCVSSCRYAWGLVSCGLLVPARARWLLLCAPACRTNMSLPKSSLQTTQPNVRCSNRQSSLCCFVCGVPVVRQIFLSQLEPTTSTVVTMFSQGNHESEGAGLPEAFIQANPYGTPDAGEGVLRWAGLEEGWVGWVSQMVGRVGLEEGGLGGLDEGGLGWVFPRVGWGWRAATALPQPCGKANI
jgi:hypothetical protein